MKISKHAPIICAIAWTICMMIAVFNPNYNYRPFFIVSTAMLAVTYLLWYLKEKENGFE